MANYSNDRYRDSEPKGMEPEVPKSAGMEEATEELRRIAGQVGELRENLQVQMEGFSKRASDLRDQAATFDESAEILRRFLYGSADDSSKKMG
jgi:hypothetical protein